MSKHWRKSAFSLPVKQAAIILRRADPPTTLPVPDHKELAPGTLRSIIRQAGLSVAEFIALL